MTSTDRSDRACEVLAVAAVWTLDLSGTTIEFRTRSLWGLLKIRGSFKAVEGTFRSKSTTTSCGALNAVPQADPTTERKFVRPSAAWASQLDLSIEAMVGEQIAAPASTGLGDPTIDLVFRFGCGGRGFRGT